MNSLRKVPSIVGKSLRAAPRNMLEFFKQPLVIAVGSVMALAAVGIILYDTLTKDPSSSSFSDINRPFQPIPIIGDSESPSVPSLPQPRPKAPSA